MVDILTIATAAKLFTALVLGAMVFFAALVAPMVFRVLPEDVAGRFLRAFFPMYYKVLAGIAGLAAVAAAVAGPVWVAIVLAVVAALFLAALLGLMPRINAARDAWLAGDQAARRRFGRLHGLSVAVNGTQMIAVLVVFLALVA